VVSSQPMGVLRRIFNRPFRQARAAEGAGDYRRAAVLYAQAEAPEEAANALLFHAARATAMEERLSALQDALRWLPEGHPRRQEVQARIGLTVLEDAQRRGALGAEEKRTLEDAARRLETAGRPSEAATAFELLGREDDMARCLEQAGDIERLERLLERQGEQDGLDRGLRRAVGDYEMAMKAGARGEARAALRRAVGLAPGDGAVADLLRRLEERMPRGVSVDLRVDGRTVRFCGRLPLTLGRSEADVLVRGASVSRCHTEVGLRDGGVLVRDLDSRNGTLIRGVPVAREVVLTGETEIGLGDDVTVRVRPLSPDAAELEVRSGLDRGLVVVAGRGALAVPGVPATISFDDGCAVLHNGPGVTMMLGDQPCVLPIVLLRDDRIAIGEHVLEVCA